MVEDGDRVPAVAYRQARVFRDDTNLEVSPDLWGKITEAMDRARYLVVLLSPNAAQSYWVNREVQYWLEHHPRERLLLVLAAGRLDWDPDAGCFDPATSDAALPALTQAGVLAEAGRPPGNGRAPGWDAGVLAAERDAAVSLTSDHNAPAEGA